MKNLLHKLLVFTSLMLAIVSCQKEENLQPEGQWELSQAIIIQPTTDEVFVLDETAPNGTITFSWEPAISSEGYAVKYSILIDTLGSTSFDSPIIEFLSSNLGNDTSATISYHDIDEALSYAGYPSNETVDVTWAVKATSLSKNAYAIDEISIGRFETEILPTKLFVSGTATENSDNLSQAIALKRLTNSDGAVSNIHEVYTSLTAGNTYKFYSERSLPAHQYGGADGALVKSGVAITVEESGQYRVTANLDDMTFELLRIDHWGVVGSPIVNGWGGDEHLEYQGGGIWKASIELVSTGGFVFRANGDWAYLLKHVVGTPNNLIMESQAASQGLSFEDIPSDLLGSYFVTLNLSADGYTYTFEEDNTVIEPIETPSQLYLFADGVMIKEFNLDGNTFSLGAYIPMQNSVNYTLNSLSDNTGTSYSIQGGLLGQTNSPDGDRVFDNVTLTESSDGFTVESDRALKLSFKFETSQVEWVYYNLKLFHWQDWDTRDEFLMTYVNPSTYTITTALSAGYEMKFISPWDFEMGSDSPSSLTGDLTNGGGSNIVNITTAGTYQVTIHMSDDFQTGTYEFVAQ